MRKERNEISENKKRLNVFDIILVVVIIAVVGLIIFMTVQAIPKNQETTGDVSLSYVITVNDIHEDVATQITTGQKIYDVNTGKLLGTVSSVVTTPYIIKGVDEETGGLVVNTVEGRCNINITVSAMAKTVNESYQVSGVTVACGLQYRFRTATAALSGTCVSLKNQ